MQQEAAKFIRGANLVEPLHLKQGKLGMHMAFLVPKRLWESCFHEFVGGLPLRRCGHGYLFVVVVDIFSKMCIQKSYKKSVLGKQAAELFFSNVPVHFGLPKSIVSDGESIFVGIFCCTCGTKWLQDSKSVQLSIHQLIGKQRWCVDLGASH